MKKIVTTTLTLALFVSTLPVFGTNEPPLPEVKFTLTELCEHKDLLKECKDGREFWEECECSEDECESCGEIPEECDCVKVIIGECDCYGVIVEDCDCDEKILEECERVEEGGLYKLTVLGKNVVSVAELNIPVYFDPDVLELVSLNSHAITEEPISALSVPDSAIAIRSFVSRTVGHPFFTGWVLRSFAFNNYTENKEGYVLARFLRTFPYIVNFGIGDEVKEAEFEEMVHMYFRAKKTYKPFVTTGPHPIPTAQNSYGIHIVDTTPLSSVQTFATMSEEPHEKNLAWLAAEENAKKTAIHIKLENPYGTVHEPHMFASMNDEEFTINFCSMTPDPAVDYRVYIGKYNECDALDAFVTAKPNVRLDALTIPHELEMDATYKIMLWDEKTLMPMCVPLTDIVLLEQDSPEIEE